LTRLAIAALLLFDPASAFARAGGGGGYHGGGGGGHGGGGFGGGGHGGGGGDAGWIFYLLYEIFIHHPLIGISLVVIVTLFYFFSQRTGTPPHPISTSPDTSQSTPNDDELTLAPLRAADPNFDLAAFCQRVSVAFHKTQAAWCAQNLSTVRPFISDGVHERFSLQFAEQRAEGWRDQMDNIVIHDIDLLELQSDGLFDELSVRIEASAADYRVSPGDGKRVSGSTSPERFVEVWTFLRHRGAVTQVGQAGLIEGNCPNCGAPVELNQTANCAHCKALLRSGQYDWVLSEITQEIEWDGQRHDDLPGLDEMRSRDPEFNAVELEDRASVIYWRKATADRLGRIDPLRKCASAEFCEAYAPLLRPGPDGRRQSYANCAVGSVRLLGVIADVEKGDRSIVEARWSGNRIMLGPDNARSVSKEDHLAYSLFVLYRQGQVRTNLGKGISSAHCPGCGAPESDSAASACDFCGAVLNDGSLGWVLVDIANRADSRGQGLLAEMKAE
jgi:predicted lipid-binding transport protein (Tim44 family)